MILKKEFNILKKPYLTPRIEFEEIEADEREMLLDGSVTDSQGHDYESDPENTDPDPGSTSLKADFVVNDVNSEFKW